MSSIGNRKRRQQPQISNRIKQAKGIIRPTVEDIYPQEVGSSQSISPEMKQYINELQREYIDRYNALFNNRLIYEELLQNISTQLDERGMSLGQLSQLYRKALAPQPKGKMEDNIS